MTQQYVEMVIWMIRNEDVSLITCTGEKIQTRYFIGLHASTSENGCRPLELLGNLMSFFIFLMRDGDGGPGGMADVSPSGRPYLPLC